MDERKGEECKEEEKGGEEWRTEKVVGIKQKSGRKRKGK